MPATYRSGDWIRGQYTVGATARAFRGWAFTGFARGGAAKAIAGTWEPLEGTAADLNQSFAATADGELELSFRAGSFNCNVQGPIGPVNPAFGAYEADVTINCGLVAFLPSVVDVILAVFDSPDRPGGGNHAIVLAIIHNNSKIGFGSLFMLEEET